MHFFPQKSFDDLFLSSLSTKRRCLHCNLMHKMLCNISKRTWQVPSKHFSKGVPVFVEEGGGCAMAQWHNGQSKPVVKLKQQINRFSAAAVSPSMRERCKLPPTHYQRTIATGCEQRSTPLHTASNFIRCHSASLSCSRSMCTPTTSGSSISSQPDPTFSSPPFPVRG